ncbi:MAG: hypothetical protein FWH18_05730 [Marinilabiliaceae bacterium]|nr:hypothetical protein [Marinilabiliaceae bacterium]
MASIVLNYDNYNIQALTALNNILTLGLFKMQTINKIETNDSIEKINERFFYSVSENVLAKDWLNKEEDETWKNL